MKEREGKGYTRIKIKTKTKKQKEQKKYIRNVRSRCWYSLQPRAVERAIVCPCNVTMLQCYTQADPSSPELMDKVMLGNTYFARTLILCTQSVHKYTPSDNSRTLDLWSSLCSFKRINAHEPSGILSSSGVARCIVAREFLNEPPISALYIQLPRALC